MKNKYHRQGQLTQLSCDMMAQLMENILIDLHKIEVGNKAAAQRVRVNTIRLEKIAKNFRKNSLISHAMKRKIGYKL